MAFLRITPGVSALAATGRVLSGDPLAVSDALKDAVLKRDDYTCRYCGFRAERYQDINYTGGDKVEAKPESYVAACVFCHQCFHLERVALQQSGTVIFLPEIGQAALNHMCRAIYLARITQGPVAESAREALDALLARRAEAKARIGTDDPRTLASVLQEFLEEKEYAARAQRLKGIRILPLDRRIVREGELEFNQFPQILAWWRGKDGPFADVPPRDWPKMFYEARLKAA